MKRSSLLQHTTSALGAMMLLFAFHATAPRADALIVANFDGGNTDQQVDGNPGKAGNGWANAWSQTVGGGASLDRDVVNTTPLAPGAGNYLFLSSTNTSVGGGANRNTIVRRTYEGYGGVTLNTAHTVSFLYRVDSGYADANMIGFFDSFSNTFAANADSSFYIRSGSGVWGYYTSDTSNLVSAPVAILEGNVYSFTIHLDPVEKQWRFTVTDLTSGATFSSSDIDFYGANFRGETPHNQVGGQLQWNMQLRGVPDGSSPARVVTWSLDSVHIAAVPEPSTAALLFGGGISFLWLLRARTVR